MELKLTATGATHDGKGVCRYNGKAVFVEGLIVGETALCGIVSQGKKFDTARVISVETPSNERIEPDCEVFEKCGGCNYRHMTYEMELRLKAQRVRDAFKKLAKTDTGEIKIHPSENILRNKVTFQFSGFDYGFYEGKSHNLVEVEGCKIIHPEMLSIANAISDLARKHNVTDIKTLSIRVNRALSEISVALEASKSRPDIFTELAKEFPKICAINLNGKNIYGKGHITDTLCGNTLNISPLSFYQINPPQAEKAYILAADMAELNVTHTALDLCCGIGSITLYLAKRCKEVYGAEIVPAAIENAKENAKINGIENAHFVCADAAKALQQYEKQGIRPDIIFVDPPRAGLDMPCKEAIAKFAPEKIAYISCDCATQARDAMYFFEQGYKLEHIEAVDFFPRTAHIETVILLSRKDVHERIKFDVNVEDLHGRASSTATYSEIKAYILEKYGLKVSSLYIAQIKDKCGFEKRDNYNIGEGKSKELICPPEKEQAIMDAFRHFGMLRD